MSHGNLSKVRIMLVDDNPHMINIVKAILRSFGAERFSEASGVEDALKLLKSEKIDLVIVDYLMDGLDGADFIRLARTDPGCPNPYVPIVMLSAYSERSRVEAARDAGVTEFCCKPVTPIDLYRKVSACINAPRPYVRALEYFGPDRRRRRLDEFPGEERRVVGPDQAVENS